MYFRAVKYVVVTGLMALVMGACSNESTPAPEPTPTPTPIPGFVGGEEDYAYQSFLEYYSTELGDCFREPIDGGLYPSIDDKYKGRAIYVGDGIWRFYVGLEWYDSETEAVSYSEKMVEVRSLPHQAWPDVCTSEQLELERERQREQWEEERSQP